MLGHGGLGLGVRGGGLGMGGQILRFDRLILRLGAIGFGVYFEVWGATGWVGGLAGLVLGAWGLCWCMGG